MPAADASTDVVEEEASPEKVEASKAHRHVKSFWREVLETVLLTIMIFFLVKGVVANFRIQGSSMEPSFHTNQLVLVNKASYFHFDVNSWLRLVPGVHPNGENVVWMFGGPHRGDVVIFQPPDALDEDYIKRVIGLPGDTVEIKGGKVYVNNVPLDEPYIREAPFSPFNATKVPPNHLFVMGDNRNASRDSRSFGMLPVDEIVGKALLVYWPIGDKWGPVPEVKY
ncbi:MAG TPA: signal peptidase I [Chloroflexia bacterium]|nr:signal peptidase I [Chloroflexia bacterium]